MSINRWTSLGRITADPEVRFTQAGVAVATFTVACNYTFSGNDGQKAESVYFQRCTAFKGSAEFLGKYVTKGDLVYVEGRLTTEEWEDKQTGQKRQAVKCLVNHAELCAKPRGKGQQPTKTSAKTAAPAPSDNDGGQPEEEDDIPF